MRKSGLSFPYFSTHSSNGIFLKGGFEIRKFLASFVKTSNKTGSNALKTSSCVTNDIS